MKTNATTFLVSLATLQFSLGLYHALETSSFDRAFLSMVVVGLAWAFGSLIAYVLPEKLLTSRSLGSVRWIGVLGMSVAMALWAWVGPNESGLVLAAVAFVFSGALIPSLMRLCVEDQARLRSAYTSALVGGAVGATLSTAIGVFGVTASYFWLPGALVALSPVLEPGLFFIGPKAQKRWLALPLSAALLAVAYLAPAQTLSSVPIKEELPYADAIYQLRSAKRLDVYVIGANPFSVSTAVEQAYKFGAKSLTVVADKTDRPTEPPAIPEDGKADGLTGQLETGSGRRRLEADSRRYDLIQYLLPSDAQAGQFAAQAQGTLTVDALKVYFDRLKDDGTLQILGRIQGARAQSIMATVTEAWKKSARKDVDLHTVAVGRDQGKEISSIVVRISPIMREEREQIGKLLNIGKEGMTWVLVSDASGVVLTDDHPFLDTSAGGARSAAAGWICLVGFLFLLGWITLKERRKGIASRWQTLSVATYFGGLGLTLACFQIFFILRAVRAWGLPEVAIGMATAAVFTSLAVGGTVFAGHPKRRYGVRIQSLLAFVFASLFTYLSGALFEPMVASGSEWLSAFVGITVLIPFGLAGGAFLPNALEEASEKLPPRTLFLLWALFAMGAALGLFCATYLGLNNGLSVVFLAGLFCFVWIAIIGGLIRPWSTRKTEVVEP